MNFVPASVKTWWHEHVQKTMGFVTFALAGADMTPYAVPIKAVFGKFGDYLYSALFLLAGLVTVVRGFQASSAKKNILPPPVDAAKVLLIVLCFALFASASVAVAAEPITPAIVPPEKNAPVIEGHPLTSVVVTQCSLIVAIYMTMPDGRLLRFDKSTALPSEQLLTMAYSATRSERVEVSCNDTGPAGYEKHEPV